eukprot:CAMPEP_0118709576 /NCGR_PEP_ID=MMETSP0800-20121206/22742_1 /TAXON_ID=210618 ORGANISM="Striatella unipunctata, Strain CCMP2910" /NCGR_SAMPLE_ID=MMETSP0800 /ASSEMBLY_ACC=CAM_ASM_000638 /LENGTH=83 /DNA_ID=CAMNT_0006613341 /DNA_START=159 /DNA_END=410 /DNA_ORIENTATION=+
MSAVSHRKPNSSSKIFKILKPVKSSATKNTDSMTFDAKPINTKSKITTKKDRRVKIRRMFATIVEAIPAMYLNISRVRFSMLE